MYNKNEIWLDENHVKPITVNYENKPCYDIIISDSFEGFGLQLETLNISERKLCIVSDSNVSPLYLDEILSITKSKSKSVISVTIPAGEESKNLDNVNKIYEELIINKFDRNDLLIALGGGVVGDLTGFCAATFLRGIKFIQVPTTLLSQVDSSIGGKTGVDFKAYKNMVGAFHQPSLVYINVSTLNSLPRRVFLSGMGEIIKHGIIKDKEYFYSLLTNAEKIVNRDTNELIEMIYNSCIIKKLVVESDPKEAGERALLNFGHTIGHAIEKLYNFKYLHGECVALGMVVASRISKNKGFISENEVNAIIKSISVFELPIQITDLKAEKIIEVTKNDKKMDKDKIKFILMDKIGHAFIDTSINDEDMKKAILETSDFDQVFGAAD